MSAGVHRLRRRSEAKAARVPIAQLDRAVLTDYCVCVTRIVSLEVAIAAPWHETSRGPARSPFFSPLSQYRGQLRLHRSAEAVTAFTAGHEHPEAR